MSGMAITILTSRAFDHDIERAMKAAAEGPVFITDRGQPTHILLSIAEYRRLPGQELSIGVEDIEITFPRSGDLPRAVDLS